MTEAEANAKADELLPCFCYRHVDPFRNHHGTCPAYFAPAVAVVLLQAAQWLTKARVERDRFVRKCEEFEEIADAAKQAAEDLRAELAAAKASVELRDADIQEWSEALERAERAAEDAARQQRRLLEGVLNEMLHARVFINSREKIHPIGSEQYDEMIRAIQFVLAADKPASKDDEPEGR